MPQQFKKKKAIIIADYFIRKNQKDKKGLTNKKLQKLLYYSQAWSLALKGKKIFPDDIQAWVHGPTVPFVYHVFKDFGFGEINKDVEEKEFSVLSIEEKELLDNVWEVYGKYDANYLEVLSHSESPWQEARKGLSFVQASHNIISPSKMKNYYGEKIKEASKNSG